MKTKDQEVSSVKNRFIKEIESRIIAGAYPAGMKLPTERELASEMGISKTAVNGGIAEMAVKGFLEIKPRKGTYVADYKKTGKIEVILSIMDYNYNLLSEDDIRSFLEMRLALEKIAFHSAIPSITEEQLDFLAKFVDEMTACENDEEACNLNYDFHHGICCISKNTIAPLVFSSFRIPILNMWQRYCRDFGREKMKENAVKLFNEIKKRDPKKALIVLEESINQAVPGVKTGL